MEINFAPTPFLYIFSGLIVGTILGWMIGFFDSNNRSSKKIREAEIKAESIIREAEKKIAQTEQQQTISAPQPAPNDSNLLILKHGNGRFTLEMDKEIITVPLTTEKKKRLIELVTILRPWIEGGQIPQPPAPIPAPQKLVPAPAPQVTPIPAVILPAKKPEAVVDIRTLSIVNQIDTVLQEKIINTPLANSGVRLVESAQGGVEVYVGLDKFLSVDEVPDENIKAIIRSAIAEWEKKFT